ncbi:DUF4328 domain-containing protein [Microtetraspora glauca]|uniref:DUF4328 domain-containing protein n=1 Tax=Microtetraspora glauca TaxID=1996 RepID=A0ABV3GEE9_MICGL
MPVRSLRPIRALGTTAVVLLAVSAVASAGMSTAYLVGGEPHDRRSWLLIGLYALAHVPAGIAVLGWLSRARANAYAISPECFHRYAALFMMAGWFLPVANLFVPKGIIDDIWAASRPGHGPRGFGGDLRTALRPALVWTWWLAYLAMIAAGGAAARVMSSRKPLGSITLVSKDVLAPAVLAAHVVLALVAGALAIAVVLKITAFQEIARVPEAEPVA